MLATVRKIQNSDEFIGVFLVLLGTLGFSIKAILIKLIYEIDPGIDAISVLTLRFVVALPFLIMLLYYRESKQFLSAINTAQFGIIFMLGAVGYYVSAILDFSALMYIPAGLERLILFLFPTFVVIISMIIRPHEITRATIIALVLSYAGILLVFIEKMPQFDPEMIKGSLLVFAAAIVFALYTIASVSQIKQHGSVRFAAYSLIAAATAAFAHAFIVHGFSFFDQSVEVYSLILPMAIFSTVVPMVFIGAGINRIGASSASIVSTSGPVITISLALVILGETIGPLQMIGSVMIMLGVFFVARKNAV